MNWRKIWREGFAQVLSDECLMALRDGLSKNDPRIVQKDLATLTFPNWTVKATCPIGYCGWKAEGLQKSSEICEFRNRIREEVDSLLGMTNISDAWFYWVETASRQEMVNELLSEVEKTISSRLKAVA